MTAEQLKKLLELYPEAKLTTWGDEVGSAKVIYNDDNTVTIDIKKK